MAILGIKRLYPPIAEPVSVAAMKEWLREDETDQDDLIAQSIADAREFIEDETQRSIVQQQWLYTLDQFPPYDVSSYLARPPRAWIPQTKQFQGAGSGTMLLPRSPVISVDSISYLAPDTGALTTLDPATYTADLNCTPVRVTPSYGNVWPVSRQQIAAVSVVFSAGYVGAEAASEGDFTDCPAWVRKAICLLVAHWYENREASTPLRLMTVPLAVERLIQHGWDGRIN